MFSQIFDDYQLYVPNNKTTFADFLIIEKFKVTPALNFFPSILN